MKCEFQNKFFVLFSNLIERTDELLKKMKKICISFMRTIEQRAKHYNTLQVNWNEFSSPTKFAVWNYGFLNRSHQFETVFICQNQVNIEFRGLVFSGYGEREHEYIAIIYWLMKCLVIFYLLDRSLGGGRNVIANLKSIGGIRMYCIDWIEGGFFPTLLYGIVDDIVSRMVITLGFFNSMNKIGISCQLRRSSGSNN